MGFFACVDDESIGPSVQGCRDDFDFTLKFEQIFLSILPSSIFIALSLPRAVSLLRKPNIVGGTLLQCVKIVFFAVYAILTLAVLVFSAVELPTFSALFVAAFGLRFLAAICMSVLSHLEHRRSPRPSILLNVFIILSTLFDVAQTRSFWLAASTQHEITFTRIFTAVAAWKATLISIESWQKNSWLLWDRKGYSPEETTGLYGLATFFWLNPLFLSGYKKVLAIPDLFALDKHMSSEVLQLSFSRKADTASFKGHDYGLARALGSTLAVPLLLPIAPRIALVGLVFCQPFLLETLLDHLSQPETNASAHRGYGLIGATILIYTGIPVATAFYWYFQERCLCMVRACLATAVYRKTIHAKVSTADDSAALTLMSADIERIRMGFMQLHEFWANPIQVALACWLLQRQIGVAFVAPIVVVAICVTSSTVMMRYIGPRQMAWMQGIQKRVGHTANIIANMKSLKISGLASPVEQAVQELRVAEVKAGGKFRRFLVGSVAIGFTPILLAPVFTLAFTSQDLDVTTIFTSISYLFLLTEPLSTLFQIAPQLLAGFSCLRRVQDFLEKDSRHDFRNCTDTSTMTSEKPTATSGNPPAIKIINGSFGWSEQTFVLKKLDLSIPSGLTVVIGPVASGKSTLCKAMLGETPFSEGQVIMGVDTRVVGYCDQAPFLWNATIKDNIVGFSEMADEKRYTSVIEATMLVQDLLLLPKGDQTTIGSNGLSLSGGQKQRISLARALYQQCDLLIVDDVLSGLDADTAENVFQQVFGNGGLLKRRGTTTVLCTHATRHLPSSDYVIALTTEGTVAEQGKFDQLLEDKMSVAHSCNNQSKSEEIEKMEKGPDATPDSGTTPPDSRVSTMESDSAETSTSPTRIIGDAAVFGYYFRSIGLFYMSAFAAFGVICGFFYNFPTVWLKFWSEDITSTEPKRSTPFYIGLYALFQFLALGSLVVEAVIGLLVIIKMSGTTLHQSALNTLFAAPLRFYSGTDTGVITNLFSQDMTLIDGELPQALINTSLQTWIGLGTAAVVATSSPYIIIAYPFIVGLLYSIQRFYLRTSRQLRLIDLEAKSPLYEKQVLSKEDMSAGLALREITLNIEPGQKVALCGRTGSGKSSVLLLLLRLLDPLPFCNTNISIDGHPLHTIDRATLRERLVALPQDAVFLPDGTSFKMNLDPFSIATNEECQSVLELVRLWALVDDRGGLEAGMNADMLSQGQKQLFSLARGVLRRRVHSRQLSTGVANHTAIVPSPGDEGASPSASSSTGGVLILDEFTSGVDKETEQEMQEIIEREFDGCTVIMVSHRLEMVMGFDKVVVLDAGRIVEDGVPVELVERENSRFRHLWTTLGKTEETK
ncbi:ABC transporter FUM19 [Colletotrichum siamense]|uniref:ABC transporter FUM19 n=1 Tax=Colletotrichum siamense TaxID=690259 RepID=UPI00187301B3|nr:ABC transporter FUM19 [Colletotrichum siamense]KAF5510100.1 ABC transporter FUM19 [Colletotrichum siamense]